MSKLEKFYEEKLQEYSKNKTVYAEGYTDGIDATINEIGSCERCKHFDARDRYCIKLGGYNIGYCGKFEENK